MNPAFCTFSRSAMNSSNDVGGLLMPDFSKTSLFAHTQLVEWTLTGAAIQLPPYLENFCSAAGTVLSHPSLLATSFKFATTPCLPQSRMSNPSICTAVGGLPAVTRARNAVIAASPPPPATGASFHLTPCFSRLVFNTFSAAASPPEVHQCITSTLSSACAGNANDADRTKPDARPRTFFLMSCLLTTLKFVAATHFRPVVDAACCPRVLARLSPASKSCRHNHPA